MDYAVAYGLERVQSGRIIARYTELRALYAQTEVEHFSLMNRPAIVVRELQAS